MTAGTFHFTIEQGTDLVLPLTYRNPAVAPLVGAPIDLTGCSASMMIRRAYDDAAPLVSLSTTAGGIVLGGAAGTILISVDSSVTALLPAGTAVYDLLLLDSLGNPMRLVQGNVTISPAVTHG